MGFSAKAFPADSTGERLSRSGDVLESTVLCALTYESVFEPIAGALFACFVLFFVFLHSVAVL